MCKLILIEMYHSLMAKILQILPQFKSRRITIPQMYKLILIEMYHSLIHTPTFKRISNSESDRKTTAFA